jgi:endonuclease/exonuclease/phosphatase family metal-dependent hydrolase
LFLYPGFRRVLFARIDHPTGLLDVFSTHLASGSDGAQNACGLTAPCPAECAAAGAPTVRTCQAVQMAQFVESRHDVPGPAVIMGDFNDPPGSFVYEQFVGRGWTDAYLAAGNPECDDATGVGCTSGRIDDELTHLELPASNEVERIDFIFVVPPQSGSACVGHIDSGNDADGDGVATKIFADDPNPFAPTCGPAPAAICWPSDHEGMQLDLNCG